MNRIVLSMIVTALSGAYSVRGQADGEVSPLDVQFRRQAVRRLVFDRNSAIPLSMLKASEVVNLAVEHPSIKVSGGATDYGLDRGQLTATATEPSESALWIGGFNPFATYDVSFAGSDGQSVEAGVEFATPDNKNRLVVLAGFSASECTTIRWQAVVDGQEMQNEVTRLYDGLNLYGQMHHISGAAVARELLKTRGIEESDTETVVEIIRAHVRGNGKSAQKLKSRTECHILYDADLMDANLGLVAFFRNIEIVTHRHFERTGNLDLQEYLEYLPSWIGMKHDFLTKLLTESGRRIGFSRQERKRKLWETLQQEQTWWDESRQFGLLGIIEYFMQFHEDPDLDHELQGLRDKWLPERYESLQGLNRDAHRRARYELAREFVELIQSEVQGKA